MVRSVFLFLIFLAEYSSGQSGTERPRSEVCINLKGQDSRIKQNCYCGGVLIDSRWVLSAAHCFKSNDSNNPRRKSQFQFVVGLSTGQRQLFQARNIILHEGYRPVSNNLKPITNDIAMVELDGEVKIDGHTVSTINLPINDDFCDTKCWVGSWGTQTENQVSTLTNNFAVVKSKYGCSSSGLNTEKTILKGGTGGSIACEIQDKTKLAGIVLSSKSCGKSGAYLPIADYVDWINYNRGIGTSYQRKAEPESFEIPDNVPTACDNIQIVTRKEWKARPPRSTKTMSTPVDLVFVHHTESNECATQDICSSRMRGIQNDHMDNPTKNYADIGYSFLIGGDGRIYEGRGWDLKGAHTEYWNDRGLAFSVIGNYMKKLPNAEAFHALRCAIKLGVRKGKITPKYKLYGHRDMPRGNKKTTDCPGDKLHEEIKTWCRYGPINKVTGKADVE